MSATTASRRPTTTAHRLQLDFTHDLVRSGAVHLRRAATPARPGDSSEVFEASRSVHDVPLEGAGAATTGGTTLTEVIALDGEEPDLVLAVAGALGDASEHPVAQAIATGARGRLRTLPMLEDFSSVAGLGVQGVVTRAAAGGSLVSHVAVFGRTHFVAVWSESIPAELRHAVADAEARGHAAVAVAWDGEARGVLVVAGAQVPIRGGVVAGGERR